MDLVCVRVRLVVFGVPFRTHEFIDALKNGLELVLVGSSKVPHDVFPDQLGFTMV
jgi:hypothetical protein